MENPENAVEQLQSILELASNKVQKETKIVTPKDLDQDYFLHIARSKFDYLIPNVSKRAAPSEDNTIPRVHVSPSLLGCLRGYASFIDDTRYVPTGAKSDTWLGGYYIYVLPFQAALKPSLKLVYDADYSDEHWLVAYNTETRFFKPSAVLKIVLSELKIVPGMKERSFYITYLLENTSDITIKLSDDVELSPGYWEITLKTVERHSGSNRNAKVKTEDDLCKYHKVTKKEFDSAKSVSAAMLSH